MKNKPEKNEYRKMPEPIDATPEELAKILLATPNKQRKVSGSNKVSKS